MGRRWGHPARWGSGAVLGLAVGMAAPGPALAGPAGMVEDTVDVVVGPTAVGVDSTPELEAVVVPGLEVAGAVLTEGAWSGTEAGALQLLEVGANLRLPAGFRAHVGAHGKWGREATGFPSAQGLSSADAADFGRVREAWVEWSRPGLRVKTGRVDANTEFAAVESAGEFANPSFGLSPVLTMLPSYPGAALSANAFVRPWAGGPELAAGVYRRGGAAWAVVGELRGGVPRLGSLRWSLGLAGDLVDEAATQAPSAGSAAYVMLEGASRGGVTPFIMATASLGAGPDHVVSGVTVPVLPALPGSVIGTGISVLRPGSGARDAVAEAFVALRPLPWLVIQSDVQVHVAPGSAPTVASVLRLRMER